MASTDLGTRPHAGADEAFRLARKAFLAGERIDMQRLATELGVNRVTLYRWVGNRARLLGEVAWALAERTIDRQLEGSRARGGERVAEVVTGFIEGVRTNEGMRKTVAQEGPVAVRLLTAGEGAVQPRLVEKFRSILEAEVAAGAFTPAVPLDEIAYALVRVCEACVYLDLLVDQHPDLDRVARMIRAVIH
ncbi:MAG: QsdR family transcriptional regulator [Actinomycetota bacterium]|jgi:AcrR family transcriptional regulator